ncbi:polysaccharide deacetylase family protein [Paenibacillus sp. CC-CFT747]|nr:polysaccharide deacetylase family protein [Paenibacillus sp. CC-CFT747]
MRAWLLGIVLLLGGSEGSWVPAQAGGEKESAPVYREHEARQSLPSGDPVTSVPILLYHRIAEDAGDPLKVSPAHFAEEMAFLKEEGFHSLSFRELEEAWNGGRPLPPKPVILTFDDGYEDNYTAAYPILKQMGMRATVFAVTGSIGKPGRLTWDQLRRMEASGLIDTQSHTVTHPDLTKLTGEEKLRELTGSREAILRRLGHPAGVLAYPYGFYDRPTLRAARQAGYRLAVTTEPGPASPEQGRLALHRVVITGDMSMNSFQAALQSQP